MGDASGPVYDLKGGVRGKYVDKISAEVPDGTTRRVWAPLIDFPWAGTERCITSDTSVLPPSAYRGYDSANLDESLSQVDRALCRGASHWVCVSLPARHQLSARENLNSFLLALWIVRPTKTQIRLRFEEIEPGVYKPSRILDRFQWIRGQASDELTDEDLGRVADLLPRVRAAYVTRGRLRNALVLTFRGCVSFAWQAAFICWSAAIEALLTYERGRGLTDRLARAYAKLVRDPTASLEHFKRLYDVRSDIMHGRSYDRDSKASNLEDLAACSDLLRRIWWAGLSSDKTVAMLESTDDVRRMFFGAHLER
jgi:hypothetical protein